MLYTVDSGYPIRKRALKQIAWVEMSKKQFLFYVNRMKNKKVSLCHNA